MNRKAAVALLDRVHEAQNHYYAGGPAHELRAVLAPDVKWIVPGENLIAGTYRGIDQVLRYFRRRRELTQRSFQIDQRDVLAGARNRIAALADGAATIDGVEHSWSTVGLYEVTDDQIAACWLLPLDQRAFDAIWSR